MDKQVLYYAKGVIKDYPVYFPDGRCSCRYCTYLRYSKDRDTHHCSITNGFVFKEELDERPKQCPVEIEEE